MASKKYPKQYQFLVIEMAHGLSTVMMWAYLDQAPRAPKYGGMTPGYGSSGGQVGPEIGFGHKIGDLHNEQYLLSRPVGVVRALVISFHPVLANTPNLLSLAIPVLLSRDSAHCERGD